MAIADSNSVQMAIKAFVEGDGDVLKLAENIEKLGKKTGNASPELEALSTALREIGQKQNAVQAFQALSDSVAALEAQLKTAAQSEAALSDELERASTVTEAAAKAQAESAAKLEAAKQQQKELQQQVKQTAAALKDLQAASRTSGDATGSYAKQIADTKTNLAGLKEASKQAGENVKALNAEHKQSAATTKEAAQAEKQLQDAFATTSNSAAKLNNQLEKQKTALVASHAVLEETGISADNLAQAQEDLKNQAKGVADNYKNLVTETKRLNTESSELEKTIRGKVTDFAKLAASGAGLVRAAKNAISFEKAMADVAKVVDGTDEQIAALGKRIKEMSTELPIAAEGLAEMAAAGGQLGIPIEQLEQFINLSAQMSVAFGMTTEQAGQAVAKLANNFNLSLTQVQALGDAINTLGNTMAATESNIIDVMTRVGGISQQFGLSAEQASALSATLLSLGMNSEVAGTGINSVLRTLQAANVQSDRFKTGLESIGISAQEMAKAIKDDAQQALLTLLHTLEQLDKKKRGEVLFQMFGEQSKIVSSLVSSLGMYEDALGKVGDTSATSGAMLKEFNKFLETNAAKIQMLKNTFDALLTSIGEGLLPVISGLTSGLRSVTEVFSDLAAEYPGLSALATVIGVLAVNVKGLQAAMAVFGLSAVKDLGAAKNAVTALAGEFTAVDTASNKAVTATKARLLSLEGVATKVGKGINVALVGAFSGAAGFSAGTWLKENVPEVNAAMGAMLEASVNTKKGFEQLFAALTGNVDAYIESGKAADFATDSILRTAAGADKSAQAFWEAKDAVDAKIAADRKAAKEAEALAISYKGLKDQAQSLTTSELPGFLHQVTELFGQGKLQAEEFNTIIREIGSVNLKNLGVDPDLVFNQMSEGVKSAVESVKMLDGVIIELGLTTQEQSVAMEMALTKAFASVKSSADLSAVTEQMKKLAESGILSAEAMTRLTKESEKAALKIAEQLPGINSLAEAYKQLGIQSAESLKAAADDAKEAFDVIKDSGKATAQELKQGFQVWADAAVKSAEATTGELDKVTKETIKTAAAASLLSVEFDSSGKVIVKTAQESKDAVLGIVDAANKANQAKLDGLKSEISGVKGEAESASNAVNSVGSGGFDSVANKMSALQHLSGALSSVSTEAAEAANAIHLTAGSATDATDGIRNMANNAKDLLSSDALGGMKGELSGVTEQINQMQKAQSDPNLWWGADGARMIGERADAVGRVRKALLEMKRGQLEVNIAVEEYNRKVDDGNLTLEEQEKKLRTLISQADRYGSEQLSTLRSALADVHQKMLAITEASKEAMNAMQDRLDQAKGNEEEIQRRQYEKDLAELQKQLDEARAAGNTEAARNYQRTIELLKQAYAEERKAAEERRKEAKEAEERANRESKGGSSNSTGGGSGGGTTTTTVIEPELHNNVSITLNPNFDIKNPENIARLGEYLGRSVLKGFKTGTRGGMVEAIEKIANYRVMLESPKWAAPKRTGIR